MTFALWICFRARSESVCAALTASSLGSVLLYSEVSSDSIFVMFICPLANLDMRSTASFPRWPECAATCDTAFSRCDHRSRTTSHISRCVSWACCSVSPPNTYVESVRTCSGLSFGWHRASRSAASSARLLVWRPGAAQTAFRGSPGAYHTAAPALLLPCTSVHDPSVHTSQYPDA